MDFQGTALGGTDCQGSFLALQTTLEIQGGTFTVHSAGHEDVIARANL